MPEAKLFDERAHDHKALLAERGRARRLSHPLRHFFDSQGSA